MEDFRLFYIMIFSLVNLFAYLYVKNLIYNLILSIGGKFIFFSILLNIVCEVKLMNKDELYLIFIVHNFQL